MQVTNKEGAFSSVFDKISAAAVKKEQEVKQKKACLMQSILHDWKQTTSVNFWRKCFQYIDYKIIKQVYDNTNSLIQDGYTIQNPAAFFVHTLKEMGHFPFKGDKNNGK